MLHADDLRTVRQLAALGKSRIQIAIHLGTTKKIIDTACRMNGIKTFAPRGVPAKPKTESVPIHGCGGEKPAKLMPSADAIARASIWSFAVHESMQQLAARMESLTHRPALRAA